jgi:DNA-binding response OmpR family regulator
MAEKRTSSPSDSFQEFITVGPLTLNLKGLSVSVAHRDVPLTYGEFLILVALAREPYSVISRDRLAKVLAEGGLNRSSLAPTGRKVDTHIARIRRKLANAGCDCIRTMRNVGYRLVPPVACFA